MLSLGTYPDVPLKLARERRDETRAALAAGTDPSEQCKAEKAAQALKAGAARMAAAGRRARARSSTRRASGTPAWRQVGHQRMPARCWRGWRTTCSPTSAAELVFLRPGELRKAESAEFDLDGATWTIPAARMKGRLKAKLNGPVHVVPLAPQAVPILRDLHPLTGNGRYVFANPLTAERPLSDNGVL